MLLSIVLLSVLAVAVVVGYASLRWCVRHPALVPRLRWSGRLQSALAAAVELPSGTVALNAVVTIAKISFFGLAYWFLLFTMAPKPPSFSATVVISQSVGLVAYLPISFNGIGTVEISAITLFRAIDLDAAAVLSVYLTMRAITLVTAWLPTAWLMLRKPAVAG